jgi:lipoprotein-anchoring transpeptidase ErfK/SrfK
MKRIWLATFATLSIAAMAAIAIPNRAPDADTVLTAASVRLQVDLSERRLYVIEGGEISRSYPVAIGQPSYPTPKGTYNIRRIIWNPRWVPPDSKWARNKTAKGPGEPGNPMGRVKIFFSEPDYYIHGTREVDSLGEAESHGCLRMRNSDVIALAKKVMAAGGKPVQQSFVRRVINRVRSTQEVRLSRAVQVQIKA